MIEQWQPSVSIQETIDINVLQQFIKHGQTLLTTPAAPTNLATLVASSVQKQAAPWLKLDEQHWQNTLAQLPLEQLFALAAFFTLAEQQLEGWQCGAKNPAIWIFRFLKKQAPLNKEQINQLKQLTDNRYIPYGSVL